MLDVVRVETHVDVDLSLASAYLPLCVVVVKLLVVVVVLYSGLFFGFSCVSVLGVLYVCVAVDSVLTVERVVNTNMVMLFTVCALVAELSSSSSCVPVVACGVVSGGVLFVTAVYLVVVSQQMRLRVVSLSVCRLVYKCVCAVLYGTLLTLKCASGPRVSGLRADVVHDSVARSVIFVAVTVLWVYLVDVRLLDHRLRGGVDAHVSFFFVMLLPWAFVVFGLSYVFVVICVCVWRRECRVVEIPMVIRSQSDYAARSVEPAPLAGVSEDDLELLRRARAQHSL
jgi:hypothetical protein